MAMPLPFEPSEAELDAKLDAKLEQTRCPWESSRLIGRHYLRALGVGLGWRMLAFAVAAGLVGLLIFWAAITFYW